MSRSRGEGPLTALIDANHEVVGLQMANRSWRSDANELETSGTSEPLLAFVEREKVALF
jgi:hypothetical protein